jgi:hypothetical protein
MARLHCALGKLADQDAQRGVRLRRRPTEKGASVRLAMSAGDPCSTLPCHRGGHAHSWTIPLRHMAVFRKLFTYFIEKLDIMGRNSGVLETSQRP